MCELLNVRIHVSSMITPLILEEVLELTWFFTEAHSDETSGKVFAISRSSQGKNFVLEKKKKSGSASYSSVVCSSVVLSKLLQALTYSVK